MSLTFVQRADSSSPVTSAQWVAGPPSLPHTIELVPHGGFVISNPQQQGFKDMVDAKKLLEQDRGEDKRSGLELRRLNTPQKRGKALRLLRSYGDGHASF